MEPILYKKKITTITTEYYKILDELTKITNGDNEVYSNSELLYPPPGQPPMFDREIFLSSLKSYFESYGRKMKEMLAAVVGTEEQLSLAEENMFSDIWAIAALLRPFYSAEFTEKFLQSLRAIALMNLQIIDSARRGIDSKVWENRLVPWPVNDISYNLNLYNNALDREFIKSKWTTACFSWLEAMKAKLAKDDVKFNEHIAQADESLAAFSSTFGQSIMNKYPQMFVASITV